MKTRYTVALAMLAGIGIGGAAIQGLHAQAKPPAIVVVDCPPKALTLSTSSMERVSPYRD